ncbi:hypothetical protein [Clostridium sp.]|uniref:hypothetical protein n=1 Tax=Clostridium sp. TaxID=1506 RepID=UPI003F350ABB
MKVKKSLLSLLIGSSLILGGCTEIETVSDEDTTETQVQKQEVQSEDTSVSENEIQTSLGIATKEPVYNGIKTEIIGEYVSINSSKDISKEEFIKFMNEDIPKLEGFNWIVVEFGDGTALDLTGSPFFNYCEYSYEEGFTNTMGAGHIINDKIEYTYVVDGEIGDTTEF